jgi:superfamily II DNA or RNA helicase
MLFRIRLTPTVAHLEEGLPRVVDRLLTIKDPQARTDASARLKLWDGLIHFYDQQERTFPQGLTWRLKKRLEKRGHKVKLVWDPLPPPVPPVPADYLIGVEMAGEYAFQLAAVNAGLAQYRGVWWLATNAGKSICISAFTGALARAGHSSVVIVPNKFLVHQTSTDIRKYLGPDVKVGMLGDGVRQLNCRILVGTYQSLIKGVDGRGDVDDEIANYLSEAKAVVVDEGHHAAAGSYQDLLKACMSATYRIACSGSFDKCDKSIARGHEQNAKAVEQQWRTEASFGPVLARIRNEDLIERGISARPTILIVDDPHAYGPPFPTPRPPMRPPGAPPVRFDPYRPVFNACCINDKVYRRTLVRVASAMLAQGKAPFIFSHSVVQLQRLKKTFEHFKIPCELLAGRDSMTRRNAVLARFKKHGGFAVLTSPIFDEGASIPEIRGVIFAGARKAPVEMLQRIGRGLRRKKGDNSIVIADFAMLSNTLLNRHYRVRLASYKDEGFVIKRLGSIANIQAFTF